MPVKKRIRVDGGEIKKKYKEISSEVLKFCVDLTSPKYNASFDRFYVDEKICEKIFAILCKKTKSNVLLYGDPGVGKTAIVESLAFLISKGMAPLQFLNKRILSLNISKIISGAKYRGDLEERLNLIIDEIKKTGKDILFIDEIHTVLFAGIDAENSGLGISDILKPILARDDFKCIGTTTTEEYEKIFKKKDEAFLRRFQCIKIEEPTIEKTIEILNKTKIHYEDFHNVIYPDDIIRKCVYLANEYFYNKHFPDKAFDILDEVGAFIRIKKIHPTKEMFSLMKNIKDNKMKLIKALDDEDYGEVLFLEDRCNLYEKTFISKKRSLIRSKKPIVVCDRDLCSVVSYMANINEVHLSCTKLNNKGFIIDYLKDKFVSNDIAMFKIVNNLEKWFCVFSDYKKSTNVFFVIDSRGDGKVIFKTVADYFFYNFNKNFEIFNVDNFVKQCNEGGVFLDNITKLFLSKIKGHIETNVFGMVYFENIKREERFLVDALCDEIFEKNGFVNDNGDFITSRNFIFIFDVAIITEKNIQDLLFEDVTKKNDDFYNNFMTSWFFEIPYFKINYVKNSQINEAMIIFNKIERESIIKIIKSVLSNVSEDLKKREISFIFKKNIPSLLYKNFYKKSTKKESSQMLFNFFEKLIYDQILAFFVEYKGRKIKQLQLCVNNNKIFFLEK